MWDTKKKVQIITLGVIIHYYFYAKSKKRAAKALSEFIKLNKWAWNNGLDTLYYPIICWQIAVTKVSWSRSSENPISKRI